MTHGGEKPYSPPSRGPRRALMVEGWKKKHPYIGFVYIPARGCDLKSFILFLPPKTDVAYLLFNK